MPLKIIIVGGGIAGLSAAGYLRAHHEVIVLERGNLDFTVNDYGLTVVSNAFNLLQKAGIREDVLNLVPLTYIWSRDAQNNERNTTNFPKSWTAGSPSIMTKRAKLQSELFRFATSTELPGHPATVVKNAKVVKVSAKEGTVWTQDGNVYRGDLIVGADGINSYVRTAIVGEPGSDDDDDATSTKAEPGVTHDLLAFMTQVPVTAFQSEPAFSYLANPSTDGGLVFWETDKDDGIRKRILLYHIAPDTAQLVGYADEQEFASRFDAEKTTIIKDVPVSRVTKEFSPGFADCIVKLFTYSPIEAWRIRDVKPIHKWTKGKAIVIGDAAHAVTPHAGQGCNISIEDAEALGYLLKDVETPEQIPNALEQFVDLRRERTHFVARYSRQLGAIQAEDEKNDGPIDRNLFAAKIYSYTGAEAAIKAAA